MLKRWFNAVCDFLVGVLCWVFAIAFILVVAGIVVMSIAAELGFRWTL